jgi:hypothetical protein
VSLQTLGAYNSRWNSCEILSVAKLYLESVLKCIVAMKHLRYVENMHSHPCSNMISHRVCPTKRLDGPRFCWEISATFLKPFAGFTSCVAALPILAKSFILGHYWLALWIELWVAILLIFFKLRNIGELLSGLHLPQAEFSSSNFSGSRLTSEFMKASMSSALDMYGIATTAALPRKILWKAFLRPSVGSPTANGFDKLLSDDTE